jgi:hypothetical protein
LGFQHAILLPKKLDHIALLALEPSEQRGEDYLERKHAVSLRHCVARVFRHYAAGLTSCLGVDCLELVSTCLRRPRLLPTVFVPESFSPHGDMSHWNLSYGRTLRPVTPMRFWESTHTVSSTKELHSRSAPVSWCEKVRDPLNVHDGLFLEKARCLRHQCAAFVGA